MFSYNSTQNTNFIGLPYMIKKRMNIKVKLLFEQLGTLDGRLFHNIPSSALESGSINLERCLKT